jgi:hypothetical protein
MSNDALTKEELNRRFDESRRATAAMAERQIYLEEAPGVGAFVVKMTTVWLLDGTPEPKMTMVLQEFEDRVEAEGYLARARHILEFGLRCVRYQGMRFAREGK